MRTMKHWAMAAMAAAALALAGCGGGGGSTQAPADPGPDPALGMAQMAAMTAATAADTAAVAAEMAADAQTANMSADEASYALARNAATRARMAADAAQAASDAAAATDDTAEAERQQGIAEDQQALAEAEQANAVKYAGMVQMEQNAIDAEAQRVLDVADARMRAMTSYMEAEADATKAEMQAGEAEATAPGSAGAMAAREAATAAREAAVAAKAAHDAIMDGMSKAQADAEAEKASNQAMYANSGYMTAKAENNTIQTAAIVGQEQLEARDLAQAKADAEELYNDADDGVTFHYDAVVGKASDAATQANAARMAATQAMRARTDYTAANMHATAAESASADAQAALGRAMTAKSDADTARQAAMDATTSAAAKAALEDLRTANDALTAEHTGAMGAGMAYMRARDAAEMAADSLGVHVISLLIHANAQDLDLGDPADVDLATAIARAKKSRIDAVAADIATEANTAGNGAGTTTATASWAADTAADPDADPPVEASAGAFMITLDPAGAGALDFRLEAIADDPETTGTDESMPKTASALDRGLGDFMHGYQIESGTTHAIVFTDIEQTEAAMAAVTLGEAVSIANKPVTAAEVVLPDAATTIATASYDHDGDPDTNPLTGATLTCGSAQATDCSYEIVDGELTSLVGYVVTVTAAADFELKAAVAAMPDTDYLVFGVWLTEQVGGDTPADPQIAAFADGSADFDPDITLTGTAMFTGSATGVYTEGESIDYFEGNAELNADFGADDAEGTISGKVDGIVAGGMAMPNDVITFNSTAIGAGGDFSGVSRMGPATVTDAVATYPYNGMWSGQFYGPAAESGEEATTMPTGAAGTFGVTGSEGEGDAAVTRSYVGAFGAHKQ